MATALTPHLSDERLALALDASARPSPDAVVADDESPAFRDPFAFATSDSYTASAALMPETVEESRRSCGSRTSTRSRSGRMRRR